jgi:hypothetical protein
LNSGENPRRARLSELGFRIRDIVSTFRIVSTKSGEAQPDGDVASGLIDGPGDAAVRTNDAGAGPAHHAEIPDTGNANANGGWAGVRALRVAPNREKGNDDEHRARQSATIHGRSFGCDTTKLSIRPIDKRKSDRFGSTGALGRHR